MNREEAKYLAPFIQAFADGEIIQAKTSGMMASGWTDVVNPTWVLGGVEYRIKPWEFTPTTNLPGFRELRAGEEWHRSDFTEEMLPTGWRPLLLGEIREGGDQYYSGDKIWTSLLEYRDKAGARCSWTRYRTSRPLPEDLPPPVRQPLVFDDIPAGSELRSKTHRFIVQGVTHSGVTGVYGAYGFERLMNEGFKIKYVRGSSWFNCWKEVSL